MSLESCIRDAKAWAKENSDVKLSARDLENIGELLSQAEQMGATPAEKNALMANLLDQKLAHDQAVNKAVYLRNVLTQEESLAQIKGNAQKWSEGGQDKGAAYGDAFLAKIRGASTRPGVGANLDPFYMKESAKAQYLAFARAVFDPADMKVLQGLKIGDTLSRDIFIELGAMRQGTQLGLSNNDMALSLTKGIRKLQDYTLQDMKGVNPYFSENEDFLVSRIHDREKMLAAGREPWIKQAMQSFSGSFAGMTPEEKYTAFGDIYDAKKNGSYTPSEAASNDFWAPRGVPVRIRDWRLHRGGCWSPAHLWPSGSMPPSLGRICGRRLCKASKTAHRRSRLFKSGVCMPAITTRLCTRKPSQA